MNGEDKIISTTPSTSQRQVFPNADDAGIAPHSVMAVRMTGQPRTTPHTRREREGIFC